MVNGERRGFRIPHSAFRIPHSLLSWLPRRIEMILGIFSLLVVGLAALTLSERVTRAARRVPLASWGLSTLSEHLNPFRTRHALYHSGLPLYDLKIKPGEYRKILSVIEQAKRRSLLTDDLKQWARAKFIYNGVTRNVKIRVRGDTPAHWIGQRKSWRIRFPKDDPLSGMREINLIVTTDGKGSQERFTNAVFARLNLMTLRDGYAVLRINGIPQGVYYQVEHLDAPLLAYHQRPEGTIFGNPRTGLELGSFRAQVASADESAYRALQVLLDYEINPTPKNFQAALAVTDVDDYLRYIVGTTLFCSDHSNFAGDNHKLYYDGSRGKFYRIPWDIEPQRLPKVERFDIEDWMATFDVFPRWPMSKLRIALIREHPYRLRRDRMLWDLVRDDSLLTLLDETYRNLDLALWCDVMDNGQAETQLATLRHAVTHNIRSIRTALAKNMTEVRVRYERPDLASIQFAINSASGIVLERIEMKGGSPQAVYTLHRDDNDNGTLDDTDSLVVEATADARGDAVCNALAQRMLPDTEVHEHYPSYAKQFGRYRTKPLTTVVSPKTTRFNYFLTRVLDDAAEPPPWPVVSVDARNAVTDRKLTDDELRIRAHSTSRPFNPARRTETRKQFLKRHPLFAADPNSERIVVLTTGSHRINGSVVVPEGITLVIEPGVELSMGPDASVVCFGPIRAMGRADAPIRITPATDRPWGTFASVLPGEPCVFSHVHLSGGRGATVEGVLFTGALAVHAGDVTLEHGRITGCSGEDGVNFKDGTIRINETYFARNSSDALDLDFVHGEINACHFVDNKGDAIDLSGSRIAVTASRIEGSGDKGISVGERSDAEITGVLLLGNTIGIAVKDLSDARIEQCTLIGNATSLALYRKKPIFGGGHALLEDTILLDTEQPVTTDAFSTVRLEACIADARYRAPGCRVAQGGLADQLRSHDFVISFDTTSIGRGDDATGGAQAGPGIAAPPVDLR